MVSEDGPPKFRYGPPVLQLAAALFMDSRFSSHCSGLAKRCDLLVQYPRLRRGDSGEAEPIFFDIEKQHGVGDDSGGVLMVAEIDLALDAIHGGRIKDEIFRKHIVAQRPVLSR
jgi:hypothetical protein